MPAYSETGPYTPTWNLTDAERDSYNYKAVKNVLRQQGRPRVTIRKDDAGKDTIVAGWKAQDALIQSMRPDIVDTATLKAAVATFVPGSNQVKVDELRNAIRIHRGIAPAAPGPAPAPPAPALAPPAQTATASTAAPPIANAGGEEEDDEEEVADDGDNDDEEATGGEQGDVDGAEEELEVGSDEERVRDYPSANTPLDVLKAHLAQWGFPIDPRFATRHQIELLYRAARIWRRQQDQLAQANAGNDDDDDDEEDGDEKGEGEGEDRDEEGEGEGRDEEDEGDDRDGEDNEAPGDDAGVSRAPSQDDPKGKRKASPGTKNDDRLQSTRRAKAKVVKRPLPPPSRPSEQTFLATCPTRVTRSSRLLRESKLPVPPQEQATCRLKRASTCLARWKILPACGGTSTNDIYTYTTTAPAPLLSAPQLRLRLAALTSVPRSMRRINSILPSPVRPRLAPKTPSTSTSGAAHSTPFLEAKGKSTLTLDVLRYTYTDIAAVNKLVEVARSEATPPTQDFGELAISGRG
jgi:hypothetical protein